VALAFDVLSRPVAGVFPAGRMRAPFRDGRNPWSRRTVPCLLRQDRRPFSAAGKIEGSVKKSSGAGGEARARPRPPLTPGRNSPASLPDFRMPSP